MNNRDYSRTEIETAIDEWILNKIHRDILKRRLIDGICFKDLSEEFNLSIRQVQNIVYKCSDKLFKHLK